MPEHVALEFVADGHDTHIDFEVNDANQYSFRARESRAHHFAERLQPQFSVDAPKWNVTVLVVQHLFAKKREMSIEGTFIYGEGHVACECAVDIHDAARAVSVFGISIMR